MDGPGSGRRRPRGPKQEVEGRRASPGRPKEKKKIHRKMDFFSYPALSFGHTHPLAVWFKSYLGKRPVCAAAPGKEQRVEKDSVVT